MQWLVCGGALPSKLPKWKRMTALDGDNVFLSAALFGHEQVLLACAAFDGVLVVIEARHVYLPTSWLATEFPAHAERIKSLESDTLMCREHFNIGSDGGVKQ